MLSLNRDVHARVGKGNTTVAQWGMGDCLRVIPRGKPQSRQPASSPRRVAPPSNPKLMSLLLDIKLTDVYPLSKERQRTTRGIRRTLPTPGTYHV